MTRLTTLLLALALPLAAVAGPQVSKAQLDLIPKDVANELATAEDALGELDQAIADAEAAIPEERADISEERDDLGEAKDGIGEARDQKALTKKAARADIQVAKLDREAAEEAYAMADQTADVKKAEFKLAKTGGDKETIRAAKADWIQAKTDARAAKSAWKEAKRGVGDAKTQRGESIAASKEVLADAVDATDAAKAELEASKIETDLAHARVAELKARRDLVEAEIERDRAKAVKQAGGDVVVADFVDAVRDAADDHESAAAEVARIQNELAALSGM